MSALKIERAVPLAEHTTLGLGGPAEHFAQITQRDDLLEAMFGASPPSVSASASASASATASASASASAQVPDTGGPSVAPWVAALAAAVCGVGVLVSRRALRRDG